MGKVSKNKTKIKGSASSKKQNESKKKVKKQVSKVNDNLNNSISSRGKYSSFDRNEESNDNEYVNIKNDSLEEPKKVSFQTKSSVKLNLSDVPIIIDTSGNYPAYLDVTSIPYLDYTIDPSGNLFGNTICGTNNFQNYLQLNPPP